MSAPPAAAPRIEPLRFCTVATLSHLHQVTVLADTLVRHNPDAQLTVLLLEDGPAPEGRGPFAFKTLSLADLAIPDLERRASRYTIVELAMSLKARLMRAVLDRDGGPVCWLDGDCAVYGPLDAFAEQVAGASVTLTPHLLRPLPVGAGGPTEAAVMFSGSYNTGVVGVDGSEESVAFLDWWEGHLAEEGLARPEQGLFVDQRWADLVPSLFPRARISRDRTVNVAYWNLRERMLGERDGRFTVDGEQLAVYHFSGFDPALPRCPSRFVPAEVAPEGSALEALLADYAGRLVSAPGGDRGLPPFGAFPGGIRIDDRGRRLLCEAIDRGELDVPVYDGATGVAAREWLLAPGACPGGLSRWVEDFRDEIDAVREAFPDPERDGRRLLAWLRRTGAERYGLEPLLLHGPALLAAAEPATAPVVALGPGPEVVERLREVLRTIPPSVTVVVAVPEGPARDAVAAAAAGRELAFADAGDAALSRLVAQTAPRDVAVVREGAVLAGGWLEALWDTAGSGEGIAAAVPVAVGGDITPSDAEGVAVVAPLAGTAARDIDAPCVYLRRDALDLVAPDLVPDDDWPVALTTAFQAAGLELVLADDVLVGGRAPSAFTPMVRRVSSTPRGFVLALLPAPAGDADAAVERELLAAALAAARPGWFVDLAPGDPVDPAVDVLLSVGGQVPACEPHVARVLWGLGGSAGEGFDAVVGARVRAHAGGGASAAPVVLPGIGAPDGHVEPDARGLIALGADGPRAGLAAAVRALDPPGDAAILVGEAGRSRAWALARAGVPLLVAPDVAWRLGLEEDAVRLRAWAPGAVAEQLTALQGTPAARAANVDAWRGILAARDWSPAAGRITEHCREALAAPRPSRT